LKVLSLLQPWASLVVMGKKKIETRSWQTAYRGPLLIHASLGKRGALLAAEPPFQKYIPQFSILPFGAIIGKASLTDVVAIGGTQLSHEQINRLSLEEQAFGDYNAGRFAWMLEDPVIFGQPIPIPGALHVWEYQGPLPDL
jgi:activating signal cointegrator 1